MSSRGTLRLAAIGLLVAATLIAIWWDQQEATRTVAGPTASSPSPGREGNALPLGSGFDFYVLSLSWSPSYCETEGEEASRQQCASGRPRAFVVHGLWPQFESGFPQDCPTEEPSVSGETLRSLYDLMPSAGLARYQWRKHGSCAGLSQRDYFATLRAARGKVDVPGEFHRPDAYRLVAPAAVEDAFRQSNPSLPANGIAVACDKRYFREVRICLTKGLSFRPCPEVERRACRLEKAIMPPVGNGR